MNILLFFLTVFVGIGRVDITPPIGTPSAGYTARQGAGMEGVRDPLYATALFIDNGEKKIIFCSVDNLGFTYEMCQKIIEKTDLKDVDIYIASTHTHSGGGAFLNIPVLGQALAGNYCEACCENYIAKTASAIMQASQQAVRAKIGIGYGKAESLSCYRGQFPQNVTPLSDLVVIKVTDLKDEPLAVLYNYPLHPTVLDSRNRLFSADFVGEVRENLQIPSLYINGAQGDIIPIEGSCEEIGCSLAKSVQQIFDETKTSETFSIRTTKETYSFIPKPTPQGLLMPIPSYQSEINLIVLNDDAFVTIPGELSTLYDRRLKEVATTLNYPHLSIFGLTNDAHGYIILPESFEKGSYESQLSFGGACYGSFLEQKITHLLNSSEK